MCENNSNKIGSNSIKLLGDDKEIKTNCVVITPNECFSKSNILHVMLPKEISSKELEDIEEIEFI